MELEEFEKEQKMKKIFGIMVAILFSSCLVLAIQQSVKMKESPLAAKRDKDILTSLKEDSPSRSILKKCINEKFKIRFLCHNSWQEDWVNDNIVAYKINENPAALFRVVRFNADIIYIQQLSKDRLASLGQYAEGFAIEDTDITGFKAIKVKAFSSKEPHARLLDYYFVRDNTLYAMMFSVSPRSEWDNYKFIFQRIVDSFGFK